MCDVIVRSRGPGSYRERFEDVEKAAEMYVELLEDDDWHGVEMALDCSGAIERAKDAIEVSLGHLQSNEWERSRKWMRQAHGYLTVSQEESDDGR